MLKTPKLDRRSVLLIGGMSIASRPAWASSGCEILLCTKNRGGVSAPSAGDVIIIKPLLSQWGEFELGLQHFTCPKTHKKLHCSEHVHGNHPFFRIVRFPNISENLMSILIQPGFENEPDVFGVSGVAAYRSFYIDFYKFGQEHRDLKAFIKDDSRKVSIFTSDMGFSDLKKLISSRQEVFV